MADLPWENEETRNYICMQTIVTDVVSEGLRKVFQLEWNTRYQASLGAWDDTNVSGQQLFNAEKTQEIQANGIALHFLMPFFIPSPLVQV